MSGRIIAVGDPNQAIYGFRGADSLSFELLKDACSAKELPLSFCYRCSESVLRKAREIVPRIEAPSGTHEGKVETCSDKEQMLSQIQAGDFIICRTKVPVIELCLELISLGKRAFVAGDDSAKSYVSFADSLIKGAGGTNPELLQKVVSRRVENLKKNRKFYAARAYEDKANLLIVILNSPLMKQYSSFLALVQILFTPSRDSIRLSTIHKVKGLEANRVWFYLPELVPHPNAVSDWELKQEENLKYVAITRAKNELYYVWGKGENDNSRN